MLYILYKHIYTYIYIYILAYIYIQHEHFIVYNGLQNVF